MGNLMFCLNLIRSHFILVLFSDRITDDAAIIESLASAIHSILFITFCNGLNLSNQCQNDILYLIQDVQYVHLYTCVYL
jgi:hypothetical protein